MRKLIYFTMASVDGYIEGPGQNLDWPIIDEELHSYVNNLERGPSVYLYGRRMYELMAPYWSTADQVSTEAVEIEYARIWQKKTIYVFSNTLSQVEGNARLVREDPVEFVRREKEQPGADLGVGGAKLASTLMQAGLVDEYRLFIHPVLLGDGSRMIPTLNAGVKLRLMETHTFHSGVIYLRYEKAAG